MNKRYIGVKIISAIPMMLLEAQELLKRDVGYKGETGQNDDCDGYLVEYKGGYQAWSHKDVFEEAYRETSAMTFGLAIEALKKGKKVCRTGWNGKGLGLRLQKPDEYSKMTLPYIYMEYPSIPASETAPANHINARVPWFASQTDVLAEDWMILD